MEDAVAAVHCLEAAYVVALDGGGDAVLGVGIALADGGVDVPVVGLVHGQHECNGAVATADAGMLLCISLRNGAVEVVVGVGVALANGGIDSILIHRHFLQLQHALPLTPVGESVWRDVGAAVVIDSPLP